MEVPPDGEQAEERLVQRMARRWAWGEGIEERPDLSIRVSGGRGPIVGPARPASDRASNT